MAEGTPLCPSCGESLGGASNCSKCKHSAVAVKHDVVMSGSKFGFPAVCCCCLVKTDRVEQLSKISQIGGYRRSTYLKVPKCGGCAGVRYFAWFIQALGWLSILGWAKLAFDAKLPEPKPGLFWGGWLASIAIGIALTKLLPPWRRAGHTAGCKPVKLTHGAVHFHNRHFASLSQSGD